MDVHYETTGPRTSMENFTLIGAEELKEKVVTGKHRRFDSSGVTEIFDFSTPDFYKRYLVAEKQRKPFKIVKSSIHPQLDE